MNIPCIKCKGADPLNACGRSFCPIIAKSEAMFKVKDSLSSTAFFGSSPAPFVGRVGYPFVNIGILSPPEQREDAWLFDAPRYWANESFNIPEIIDFRSALINSRFTANVHNRSKFIEISQEVGMASKPVDIEIKLKDKPRFKLNTDPHVAPMGPNAVLKKIEITENPKIEFKVEKVVDDADLRANDALIYLYKNDFDENFLSKLLSVGTIGLKTDRKLVPTRWSITATDDNIGKFLISKIKAYTQTDYCAYFGSYLGNYYLILLFPEVWSYELFETYLPSASWNVNSNEVSYMADFEPYGGRKEYAEDTGGGYYAARLPILEKLDKLKRQASVLALRFITQEYAVPLGVWVVREAARKAMQSKPINFASKELMLKYAELLVKKKFGHDLNNTLKNSILLKNLKNQKKISQFL